MSRAVKLSENIASEAKIGKILEENPDLTYDIIKKILISQQEVEAGKLEKIASAPAPCIDK